MCWAEPHGLSILNMCADVCRKAAMRVGYRHWDSFICTVHMTKISLWGGLLRWFWWDSEAESSCHPRPRSASFVLPVHACVGVSVLAYYFSIHLYLHALPRTEFNFVVLRRWSTRTRNIYAPCHLYSSRHPSPTTQTYMWQPSAELPRAQQRRRRG